MRLEVSGNRVGLAGSQGRELRSWSVQLIVLAPDGASIDAETTNGPIGVKGLAGTFALRASNGPLTVSVPPDYQSGVEISSSAHSPWNCRAAACRSGVRDWDERARMLRLGSEPVTVHLSTVNGPVTINER